MNKLLLIVSIVLVPSLWKANANVGVEKLLDSYIVAQVETQQPSLSDEEIRHYPFTIQIASYLNEKDAVSHVEELRAKEKEARYFPAFVRGQIWYKVAIGKFLNREDAESYKKNISTKLDEPFAVVISLLERPANETDVKAGVMTASTGAPVAGASTTSTATAAVSDLKLNDQPRHPSAEAAANEIPSLKSIDDQRIKDLENKDKPKHSSKAKVAAANKAISDSEGVSAPAIKAVPLAKTERQAAVKKEASDSGEHFYSLQVGAYPTEELAKQKASTMALNTEMYFTNATVKGQNWVRVMAGKFKTKKEAEEFQKTKGNTLHEAFVRRVDKADKATEMVADKPAVKDVEKKGQKVSEGSTSAE